MKNTSLWIRTAIILVITLTGVYLVFGPRRMPSARDFTWQGIKDNLSENINLGLDLRGGSHLVMRVRTDDYLKTLTENSAQAALSGAQDAKLPVTGVSTVAENGNYSVSLKLADPSQAQAVIDEVKKKVDFTNWTESTSGDTITWSLPLQAQAVLKDQAVEQALKIIDSRINAFGVKEPTLQRMSRSSGQILLQMPGVDDPERVKKLIGAESRLLLMKVAEGQYYNPYFISAPYLAMPPPLFDGLVKYSQNADESTENDVPATVDQTNTSAWVHALRRDGDSTVREAVRAATADGRATIAIYRN